MYCRLSMSDNDVDFGGTPIRLPWGAIRETSGLPNCLNINTNVKSGEYVLQILFADFTTTVEKKIDQLIDGSVSNIMGIEYCNTHC